MSKKWKIFGYQTNIEWYDVKTMFKQLLRKITYSWVLQELICFLIISYTKFVYHSSKKKFINFDVVYEAAKTGKPLILAMWHNRLTMTPYAARQIKKLHPNCNFIALASRHGDGQFVGKLIEKLGFTLVSGSTRHGRKSSRGIDAGSFKKIFDSLKDGWFLAITPDGPRGPNQKINGELINIARLSGAGILPSSYSTSHFKKLNTWDKFIIPLPFSTLCFCLDERITYVPKESSLEDVEKIKLEVEKRMDFVQRQSEEHCQIEKS
jgi:lysophospholipid acyltransferase (LPLAT)-like uncharacterized protein